MLGYLPVAGTHAKDDPWVVDDCSPFNEMMCENGFLPIRRKDGSAWNWTTNLQGLWFFTGTRDWRRAAVDLADFLGAVPYRHRNVIAHSHGGQPVIIAAADGLELRSLTTIGTPVRKNLPAAEAVKRIGR